MLNSVQCCPRSAEVKLVLLSALLIPWMRCVVSVAASSQGFRLPDHLATKAPYTHRVRIKGAPYLHELPDPPGYEPIFLWLLSRHGSRWPTAKRMRQINSLEQLFKDLSSSVSPEHREWMRSWVSPTAHMGFMAGELHATGDAEMMGLAERLRLRFPGLMADSYAPRRYPIISTQVPRAAQSASAFSLGFFGRWVHQTRQPRHSNTPPPCQQQQRQQQQQQQAQAGTSSSSSSSSGDHLLGRSSWLPQPVAVSMLPRQADPLLRFFETCRAYRVHEDVTRRWLAPWMHHQIKEHIIPGLSQRLGLQPDTLHPCHVEALWQLCAFEATAAAATDDLPSSSSSSSSVNASRACELFSEDNARLMEWLDDVRLYETQGYGATVNYAIAAPLLADMATALTTAASAHARGKVPLQRTRLHFAHCETLTPLATLMGLFAPQQQQQAQANSHHQQQQQQQQQQHHHHHQQQQQQQQRAEGAAVLDPQWHIDLSDVEEEVLADLPVLRAAEAAAGAVGGSMLAAQPAGSRQAGSGSLLAPGVAGQAGLSVSDEVLADLPLLEAAEATARAASRPTAAAAGGGEGGQAGGGMGNGDLPDPGAAQFAAVAATAAMSAAEAARQLPHSSSSSSSSSNRSSATQEAGVTRGRGSKRLRQQQQLDTAEGSRMELKRHRKLASEAAPHTGSSSKFPMPADTVSSSSISIEHHHGPDVEGCSFKGSLLPSQDWLQPPEGWVPPFAVHDRERGWRSGRVAPLGANMVLLLYGKVQAGVEPSSSSSSSSRRVVETNERPRVGEDLPSGSSSSSSSGSSSGSGGKQGVSDFGDVLLRLVYNEQVVKVPGCTAVGANGFDCTLQDFLDFVVGEKTASERFKHYCYGTGVGYGSSRGAGTGAASSSSNSRSSKVGKGGYGQSGSSGATVVTADGLQVLLGSQQQLLEE